MFIAENLEEYLTKHSAAESDLLRQLRRETFQKTVQPYMISGEYQGRLLALLSRLVRPKRILELGTFTGYATLCLAEGLIENGRIITVDKNPELEHISQKYFQLTEIKNHIDYRNQLIDEFFENNSETFDLVFLDADKENYPNYLEKVTKVMNPHGLLIADNVLWYGKVLEPLAEEDLATQRIAEFNQMLAEMQQWMPVMLPLRDGLTAALKIG